MKKSSSKEMKNYLDLVSISATIHRKQSRMTRICIILAVFLVTAIFGMADMEMRSQKTQAIQSDGAWHLGMKGLTGEQDELIRLRPEIATASWYGIVNYALDKDYTLGGKQVAIAGVDDSFFEIYLSSIEGHLPYTDEEVAVTVNVQQQLGVEIGGDISIQMPDGSSMSRTVSGIFSNSSNLNKSDAFGVMLKSSDFQNMFGKTPEQGMLYLKLKRGINIEKTAIALQQEFELADNQIARNVKVLALMFQSRDPYMMQFYITAAVLAVLVTVAGVLMISSSMNSNVGQRTKFFGMMRCLGADKKQVIRFVRKEALLMCRTSIPIGVIAGVLITWILCAMLRFLSPNLFLGMPVVGISLMGIAMGIIVGFITVLIASNAPAKRAASVSPLTAVSGNTETLGNTKKRIKRMEIHVETILGIHHATGSKKNFILMTGSFAFSVILFLSFSSAVNFMNHAITPLKPYSPDLSITSPDNTCSIPLELANEIAMQQGVKRAYGRCFSYEMPVLINGQNKVINLVSYEENQFKWAENDILKGDIKDVMNGDGVLIVYNGLSPIDPGSQITFNTELGTETFEVKGTYSNCPFDRIEGVETVVCSEKLFQKVTGLNGYTIIDVQMEKHASDTDVAAIRNMSGQNVLFSDQRMGNQETRGAYYSFAIFIYGFLTIIALISIFNIINSIAMSVQARLNQYGAMRAIGMSDKQMIHMVTAEAITYGVSGIVVGAAIGLPINKLLFESLVTFHWGDVWTLPLMPLLTIIVVVTLSVFLAVLQPSKRIREMSIVDTICAQ